MPVMIMRMEAHLMIIIAGFVVVAVWAVGLYLAGRQKQSARGFDVLPPDEQRPE